MEQQPLDNRPESQPEKPQDFRYDIQNSINAAERRRHRISEVYEWVEANLFAMVLILVIFTFLVRTVFVSGSSMVPTLHDGDRLILQQVGYNDPQYGEIVVIDCTQIYDPPIIKRVIGRAGDTIDIDFLNGVVVRNGKILDEPYINEPTYNEMDVQFPVTIPQGAVFVLGDNRNHSNDSRSSEIGMVDLRRVMGKATLRFFPFGDFGLISHD